MTRYQLRYTRIAGFSLLTPGQVNFRSTVSAGLNCPAYCRFTCEMRTEPRAFDGIRTHNLVLTEHALYLMSFEGMYPDSSFGSGIGRKRS